MGYLKEVCIHRSFGLGDCGGRDVFLSKTDVQQQQGNTDNVSYSTLQYAMLCYAMLVTTIPNYTITTIYHTIQQHTKLIYCVPYCIQVQHLNNFRCLLKGQIWVFIVMWLSPSHRSESKTLTFNKWDRLRMYMLKCKGLSCSRPGGQTQYVMACYPLRKTVTRGDGTCQTLKSKTKRKVSLSGYASGSQRAFFKSRSSLA